MVKIIVLERKDLFAELRNEHIEHIFIHSFKLRREAFDRYDMVIFYDDDGSNKLIR